MLLLSNIHSAHCFLKPSVAESSTCVFMLERDDTNIIIVIIIIIIIITITQFLWLLPGCVRADCPDAWVSFRGSCYLFSHDPKTFTDGEVGCYLYLHSDYFTNSYFKHQHTKTTHNYEQRYVIEIVFRIPRYLSRS